MDAQAFWAVIGAYNQHTIAAQAVLLGFLIFSLIFSYRQKKSMDGKICAGQFLPSDGNVYHALSCRQPEYRGLRRLSKEEQAVAGPVECLGLDRHQIGHFQRL